ncbi:hypothetical protein D1AOALGA4SA_11874 [Olavius algarvensis Delta 1 endosymbiont]|nr:hypothetical protein D1AOALGA4SA_11874 [Olavius algarvensis Delta 1 endosymbiont]
MQNSGTISNLRRLKIKSAEFLSKFRIPQSAIRIPSAVKRFSAKSEYLLIVYG